MNVPPAPLLVGTIAAMRRLVVVTGSVAAAIALVAVPQGAAAAPLLQRTSRAPHSPASARFSRAVTRICDGALLFDHPHDMGTRADAVAVARDIRASTGRRLARVTKVPVPSELRRVSRRWISTQRRLAAMFARLWVRIYDTIDAAHTPTQEAMLPERIDRLVHAPDPLRRAAARLELQLQVPDCTGGGSEMGGEAVGGVSQQAPLPRP